MLLKSLLIPFFCLSATLADSYILVFEEGQLTPEKYIGEVKDKIKSFGGHVTYEYSSILTGFTFDIPKNEVLDKITKLADSRYPFFIEKDSTVQANGDYN